MIDAAVAIMPARDLLALDLWEGDLPDLASVRALQVEPRRWWLVDAGDAASAIAAQVAARGALTPFGGGFMVARITGAGWRELLSISAFVDTERLETGSVTSTVVHHVPVRIVVTATDACEVYFASSYTGALAELWVRVAQVTKGGSR